VEPQGAYGIAALFKEERESCFNGLLTDFDIVRAWFK
jgi:hypothetical protein